MKDGESPLAAAQIHDVLIEIESRLDWEDPERTAINAWIRAQPLTVRQAVADWQRRLRSRDARAINELRTAREAVAWRRLVTARPRASGPGSLYEMGSDVVPWRHPVTQFWMGHQDNCEGPWERGDHAQVSVSTPLGSEPSSKSNARRRSPGDEPLGNERRLLSSALSSTERQRRYRQRRRMRSLDLPEDTHALLRTLCDERGETVDELVRWLLSRAAGVIEGRDG